MALSRATIRPSNSTSLREGWVSHSLSAISRFCPISTIGLRARRPRLAGGDYLEDRFTARDLLKTTVLHILHHTDIVSGRPALQAYQERCEARPAFQKALADHLKPFETAAA